MPDQPTGERQAADLIVFGGTGDLSMRKLIPALYHCHRDGGLVGDTRIIAMSRGGLDHRLGCIQFKDVPHAIFPGATPNRLVLRLQPSEGIHLHLMAKEPGAGEVMLRPVPLSLSFAETFQTRVPDAYERLLMDVLSGNPTLFMRRDEVEAAWRWIDPIIENEGMLPEPYPAGTSGPAGAHELLARSGRAWHEEDLQ